jgi:chromosome segregation ATPase
MFKGSTEGDKQYLNTLHDKIEALESDKTNLKAENANLKAELVILNDSLLIFDTYLIESERVNASTIKYYEKKIRDINYNSFTDPQLDSSFLARYPPN